MGVYRFSTPQVVWFGAGSLVKLPDEARRFGAEAALVYTDRGVVRAGIAEKVVDILKQAGIRSVVWDRVVPEPPVAVAQEAVDFAREAVKHEGAGIVVGVGGGSSLDMAKACACLAANPGDVSDYLNLSAKRTLERRGLPRILIPTTSGTGSEVTNIAVFSLETTKDVIANDLLLADVAIVDPELTLTLPPRATAATGMDAFTHAIEAFTSINAGPSTDLLALEAMRLIWQSLPTAVWNGRDLKARADMAFASLLAGQAFFNAGVAAVHALAYPIGGRFHVAHGESNALMLPYVYEFIWPSCMHRLRTAAEAIGAARPGDSPRMAALAVIESIKTMIVDVGLPSRLRDYGIPEDAVGLLAEDGIQQRRLLARSPRVLSGEDILSIYRLAW